MDDKRGKETLTFTIRENPWILSTFVLGILVLVFLVGNFFGVSGNVVSADKAGENLLAFAQSQGQAELLGVNDDGNFYEVTILFNGQTVPLYVTKDGKNFVNGEVISLDSEQKVQSSSKTVPKSDKPIVELFVMSYCPYGTQAEKGILPVVALLDDKIDFKLRTVHYILHGEQEDVENKRQLCIREEQGQTKLNKYLVCILNSTNPNAPGDVVACEKEAGVDSSKLQTCLKTNADKYFSDDSALSQSYGVQGSPTLIINGVESSAGRSPSSYLQGVCSAFTDGKVPPECSEALPDSSPSAGFGYNPGTDTVAQC